VVILGDSIAAGYGLDTSEAFPAYLQKLANIAGIKVTIVNAGLSGETTSGGARRINWILNQPVDILVIELGGNDALRGLDLNQTEANLRSIIVSARAKFSTIRIILAGMLAPPNLGQEFTERFRSIYPRIAAQESVKLIPFILDGVGGVRELNQPDGIHPTAEGHERIASIVWPYLKAEILAHQRK